MQDNNHASAVATQEATDEDSNVLHGRTAHKSAVAIRKPAGAGNGYRAIHIFRPGRHTSMQGATIDFGEGDLIATAKAYDPTRHEAPLVIGHPRADAPAWGWVGGLTADEGGLFATPRQLDPAFAEMVRAGRFKKVSASFYTPDSPHNPVPGVYYLRHVGFLGAQPPAVKGLAPVPVNFAEGDTDEGCVSFDFAESPGLLRWLADLFRGLREYVVEKDGAETADRAIPSYAVSGLQEMAAASAAQAAEIPAFAENLPPKKEHTMQKQETPPAENIDFAETKARADELERKVAYLTGIARKERASRVVDKVLADGRLTPAQSVGLADFMAGLDEEGTFDFAEDGGKTTSMSPAAFMAAFLERLPKQVDFSEAAPGGEEAPDTSSNDIAQRALAYCEEMRAKGVTVSVTDAVAHVSK
ncbi:phage protease [Desulfovibrio piger]|uniref:phage protease n=1 Tax=Desulfovibrio piger TaxID=901 RepID=UPI001D509139|nr:phage protease [Desulfovibrio piger]HJG36038.1 phage protease [Desulfovibrio piger]